MRVVNITVYQFLELSPFARAKARQEYASLFGYERSGEAFASIQALAEHFGGRIVNWEVDFFAASPSSMTFSMPSDMTRAEIQQRLRELGTYNRRTLKGDGDCKLTGYCADEDAIDGFRKAFIRDKETSLDSLMQAAFKTWLKAAQEDCEDFYTDEAFADHCTANEYEFTKDGSFFYRAQA